MMPRWIERERGPRGDSRAGGYFFLVGLVAIRAGRLNNKTSNSSMCPWPTSLELIRAMAMHIIADDG